MSHRTNPFTSATIPMKLLILIYIFLAASPITRVISCNRYRSYGEPCLGFENGQEVCDTRRLLRCDPRTGTCQCPNFYYYFFDSYNARCYHKVGTACQESFGGTYEARFDHGCPENSFCNPGTGYCQCRSLFTQNYEATGCYLSSSSLKTTHVLLGVPFMILNFIYNCRFYF